MGTTTSQKSRLKFVMLLVSFILTGIIMKLLSPPGKLDAVFFYNYDYVISFLTSLSAEQRTHYFYAELIDLWYLINYSWLLVLLYQRMAIVPWLALLPGTLDVLENSLIIYSLKSEQITHLHQALPFLSSCKWIGGLIALIVPLYKVIRRFRKS